MVQQAAVGADERIRVPQAGDVGLGSFGEADGDEDPISPRRPADARQLGPLIATADAASILKRSWVRIGASSAAQIGNPGRKASGKAISLAPLPAASAMTEHALSTVRETSKNTGPTWAAATLYTG
jgi:hypothetical protein